MKKSILFVLFVLLAGLILSGCTASASAGSCAFVIGNGQSGNDSALHRVIYPDQIVQYNASDEDVYFVPCQSRNYIINDGTVKNANGDKVGDQHELVKANTLTGKPVSIGLSAYWTLNQNESALDKFWSVCRKYDCATLGRDESGDKNFATPGWNGMLSENFAVALERATKNAASEMGDEILDGYSKALYEDLSDKISTYFAEEIRKTLGFNEDIFCGSGNSQWPDLSAPGSGEFTCSPVRIVVDTVKLDLRSAEGTRGEEFLNQERFKNAEALYGPSAGYWLGLQDTIKKCETLGASCIFNIGGNLGTDISLPSSLESTP